MQVLGLFATMITLVKIIMIKRVVFSKSGKEHGEVKVEEVSLGYVIYWYTQYMYYNQSLFGLS